MAYRFSSRMFSVVDENGDTVVGARLYSYESNTSTPSPTYQDEDFITPNTNPVIADAAGRFPDMFLKTTRYKMVLKDADDVTLETIDPIDGTDDQINTDKLVALNPGDGNPGYLEDKLLEAETSGFFGLDVNSNVLDAQDKYAGLTTKLFQHEFGVPVESFGVYQINDPKYVSPDSNLLGMQAMIADADVGAIRFNEGIYRFSDGIQITKPMLMYGLGTSPNFGTSLEFTAIPLGYGLLINGTLGTDPQFPTIEVRDLHLNYVGQGAGNGGAADDRSDVGIYVNDEGCRIRNIRIEDFKGFGVYVDGRAGPVNGLVLEHVVNFQTGGGFHFEGSIYNAVATMPQSFDTVDREGCLIALEDTLSDGLVLIEPWVYGGENKGGLYIKSAYNLEVLNAKAKAGVMRGQNEFADVQIDDGVKYSHIRIAWYGVDNGNPKNGINNEADYTNDVRYLGSSLNGEELEPQGTDQTTTAVVTKRMTTINNVPVGNTSITLPLITPPAGYIGPGEYVFIINNRTNDSVTIWPGVGQEFVSGNAQIFLTGDKTRTFRWSGFGYWTESQ